MISLITGGPGTGKTAWLLDQLIDLRKNEPNREVYIHGVRGLRGFAHEMIYCKSQLCDICRAIDEQINTKSDAKFVENWQQWKTAGALIVVDEVQRIWRPRSGGSALPDSVSALETHRHYGVDFWLISQGPHLFDNFIRLLVGRHVHLVSKWSGRMQYEWPECKQDVQSRSDAVMRPYTLPKRVFTMYDSAEIHTKQEKRKPITFYVTIVAMILAFVFAYLIYNRIQSKMSPKTEPVTIDSPQQMGSSDVASSEKPKRSSFPDFTPTIAGVPESAPAYAELIQVTAAPLLAACVYNNSTDKCLCYTQQATPYPVSKPFCMEVVKNHRFNPYLVTASANQSQSEQNQNPNPNPNKPKKPKKPEKPEKPLIIGSTGK